MATAKRSNGTVAKTRGTKSKHWFHSKTPAAQKAYLASHPSSKYHGTRAKKAALKKAIDKKRAARPKLSAANRKKQHENIFMNTRTTGGVKLIGKKSAKTAGMGAAPKAPKAFKNTKTTGGVKLVSRAPAGSSGMGTKKVKTPTKFKNTGTNGGVKLIGRKRAAHMG
jgi:hypothetical protein